MEYSNVNKLVVGNRIKTLRKAKGFTQEKLARIMGYDNKSTIGKIETGVNDIPLQKLKLFARALNTSIEYLLGLDTAPVTVEKITVPLIGVVACGKPIEAVENHAADIEINDANKCDYALRCVGDSMTGAGINDGDIVFITGEFAPLQVFCGFLGVALDCSKGCFLWEMLPKYHQSLLTNV